MKLRVLKNKFLHEQINGRMRHFPAGTVFDQPNDKRALRLLEVTPALVEKAPLAPVSQPKGNGKKGGKKKDETPKE